MPCEMKPSQARELISGLAVWRWLMTLNRKGRRDRHLIGGSCWRVVGRGVVAGGCEDQH